MTVPAPKMQEPHKLDPAAEAIKEASQLGAAGYAAMIQHIDINTTAQENLARMVADALRNSKSDVTSMQFDVVRDEFTNNVRSMIVTLKRESK